MRVSTSLSWIEPRQVEINLSIVAKTHDASLLLIIKTLSRTCHSSKFPSRHHSHQQRKLMEITRNEQKITATQGDSASFEMTLTLALVNRGFVWLTLTRRYKINMYMEFMQNQKPYIDMIYRSFCALICVYRTLCKFVIRIESSAFPCIWIHNCTYLYAITMWFAYFMLKWPAWNWLTLFGHFICILTHFPR